MKIHRSFILPFTFLVFGFILLIPKRSKAFSILAHEAVIDASWEKSLKPMLLAKYPNATPQDLKTAHAYAYGGCLVPDMGYMPFGDPYFTDLLHYVRTGDFVMELINDEQNLNQYAFALGVLSHYLADEYGHSLATNKTVPLLYPKLEQKFGHVITYGDDHISHSRVELAYDALQTAKGNYASTAYHDFIGFSIDSALLATAFQKTYGESLKEMFPQYSTTVSTFRWGVRDLFPEMTHKAWHIKKDTIKQKNAGMRRNMFKYRMTRKMFRKEFGSDYTEPKFSAKVVAFIIRLLPKVGGLKKLKFINPGPEGEKLFYQSMDSTLYHYTADLKLVNDNSLKLINIDYDTGKPTVIYEYQLTDETYKDWILRLQKNQFKDTSPDMRGNILAFYSKADTSALSKKDPEVMKAIQQLQNYTATAPAPAQPVLAPVAK
jgi:hypothetical protein